MFATIHIFSSDFNISSFVMPHCQQSQSASSFQTSLIEVKDLYTKKKNFSHRVVLFIGMIPCECLSNSVTMHKKTQISTEAKKKEEKKKKKKV